MKLEFNRSPKTKMVGVRFTEAEMKQIQELAQLHNESVGETVGVLTRAALKELQQTN